HGGVDRLHARVCLVRAMVLRTEDPIRCSDNFQRIVAFVAADLAGLFPESLRFRGLSFVADLAFGSEIPFDRDEVERRLRAVPTVGDDRNSILQMVWSGSALFGPELHHGDNARTLFRRL